MITEEKAQTIKEIVHSFLPDVKILLFGSRAKGEFDRHSDYDLLIVTPEAFAPRIKMDWENKIRRALVNCLDAAFDVIVENDLEIDKKKTLNGHIIYYAMKEAIAI